MVRADKKNPIGEKKLEGLHPVMSMEDDTTQKPAFFLNVITGASSSSLGSLFGKLSRTLDCSWYTSGVLFVLMIAFNTLGMVNFAKSLSSSSSSLKATLVFSASQYVSTAFIGLMVLGEEMSFLWWCGTFLIICGITLISYQQMKEGSTKSSSQQISRRKSLKKQKII